jgi:hypothetical protein
VHLCHRESFEPCRRDPRRSSSPSGRVCEMDEEREGGGVAPMKSTHSSFANNLHLVFEELDDLRRVSQGEARRGGLPLR